MLESTSGTVSSCRKNDVQGVAPPRFDVGTNSILVDDELLKERENFNAHLHNYGYAVVANVATSANVKEAHSHFWDFCEHAKPSIRRTDPQTWVEPNWLPSPDTGIFAAMGFNHDKFCWNTRMLPAVRETFSLIWGCLASELIVSFDGGNAFRPWSLDPSWATKGGWWHVDQNSCIGPSRQGKVCVQGVVLYTDANDTTGGLCVIPGSHLHHTDVCARAPGANAVLMDYVEIPVDDPVMSLPKHLIHAKAGDLIVFDSRTVHCNTPALTLNRCSSPTNCPNDIPGCTMFSESATLIEKLPCDHSFCQAGGVTVTSCQHQDRECFLDLGHPTLLRLASYVCMLPRSHAVTSVLTQRQQAFINRIPTSHWPNKPTRCAPLRQPLHPPIDPQKCSDEQLLLVGFSIDDIAQLRAICM